MPVIEHFRHGDAVRVLLPGRFNPNVPGNRDPDTYIHGVIVGRTPGIPVTYTVKTEAGRWIHVADANVWPRAIF